MKDTVLRQLEAMKSQTIGVEVEMSNITRQNAIKVIAKYFNTDYTINHDGGSYDVWSCRDTQGRTWKIVYDSSIVARRSEEKAELTTPILKYDDIEDLQEIIRNLRKAGAISNPKHGCGVHIHVGADGHTAKTLRNIANIMSSHETLLTQGLELDRNRMSAYCRPVDKNFLNVLNTKKPETMSELADVWYGSQNCNYGRDHHYNQSRYHMLNLHSVFTKGTVEFRLFQFDNPTAERKGGLHAGQLKSYIQLCLAISQQAKKQKSANPKERDTVKENPKYAMKSWMTQMNMLGDDFKTATKIFTERLEGRMTNRNRDIA